MSSTPSERDAAARDRGFHNYEHMKRWYKREKWRQMTIQERVLAVHLALPAAVEDALIRAENDVLKAVENVKGPAREYVRVHVYEEVWRDEVWRRIGSKDRMRYDYWTTEEQDAFSKWLEGHTRDAVAAIDAKRADCERYLKEWRFGRVESVAARLRMPKEAEAERLARESKQATLAALKDFSERQKEARARKCRESQKRQKRKKKPKPPPPEPLEIDDIDDCPY